MGRGRYTGTAHFEGAFRGWGYQDFTAGAIAAAAVTLTANENGDGVQFDATKVIDGTAVIVKQPTEGTTPWSGCEFVYSGAAKWFSTKIKVNSHDDAAIVLNDTPDASWACRIYYFYNYEDGVPESYTIPPRVVAQELLTELNALFITEEEMTGGTLTPNFESLAVDDLSLDDATITTTANNLVLAAATDTITFNSSTLSGINVLQVGNLNLTGRALQCTHATDNLVLGAVNDVISFSTDNLIDIASITIANTGLHLLDTNASHDLIIAPGSDLTADRTLSLVTGDAARTITLSGNPTLADWFNQDVRTVAGPAFSGLTMTDDINMGNHVISNANEIHVGTLTLANNEINDSTGTISFGNEKIQTTGSLGVGAAADLAKGMYVTGTKTDTFYGVDVALSDFNPSAANKTIKGLNFTVLAESSSENITAIQGVGGNAGISIDSGYTGTVALIAAIDGRVILGGNTSGGDPSVTDAAIFYGGAWTDIGFGITVANGYGLYLPDIATGSVTNPYSIYSAGGPMVHAGNIRIGSLAVPTEALHFADAKNIAFDTTTGTKIGTGTSQKLGFFNATPVVQRAKANYNNWAAFGDIVNALVDLGLFDAA